MRAPCGVLSALWMPSGNNAGWLYRFVGDSLSGLPMIPLWVGVALRVKPDTLHSR
jgi:hypothetical protein